MRIRPAAPTNVQVVEHVQQPEPTSDMRALVAAAARMALDEGSVMRARVGDEEWQREAWRHYDINGELRFAANRHAGALSQCRLYVAELDDQGDPGAPAPEQEIQDLAGSIFGGPARKAEYLRTIDVQLYVGGESYVIAESAAKKDKDIWYVVTPSQIRKYAGTYRVERPMEHGGGWHAIDPKLDLMTRVWTPHPRKYDVPDSSVRSALPILREMERLSLLTFSQIDSRLISAGLLLLPQSINFPDKDGAPKGLNGLLEMILEVAQAQLTGAGTAAGLVPILGEIPAGTGNDIQHIKFETALAAEIKDKLDHAIRRLATSLDIAPEELLGQGGANHWSAWQIDESGIKLFIQPVMTRICDALTQSYLAPALKVLGKDPDKYTLWFDPSPLTVRPNRFEDAIQLWDRGVLSDEELRTSGNFSEDDSPKTADHKSWMAWKLIQADPKLLSNKELADLAGLPVVEDPAAAQQQLPPGGPQDSAVPPDAQQLLGGDQRSLPNEPQGGSPAQSGQGFAALLPGAEQAVLRALELAGGRMLDRHSRGRFSSVARSELHTQMQPTDREHAYTLLDGAFIHVPALAAHHGVLPGELTNVLREYCTELLVRGYPHSPELLAAMLRGGARG
jgi:hypothetical protein